MKNPLTKYEWGPFCSLQLYYKSEENENYLVNALTASIAAS